jgi:uroporphyrinogen decarboxylase
MKNTRENTLAAIHGANPAFVPVFDGGVWDAAMLGGNFREATWTDAWGVQWVQELPGMVPSDVVHPLADLSRLDSYAWPDPWKLTWTPEDRRRFDAIDRTRVLRGGCQIYLLCERLCSLMGMDAFLVAMYEDPDRLQVLINRIVDYTAVCFRRLMDLGIDTLHVSEDLGTQRALMMSPAMFRRFLLPAYERLFAEPRRRGVLIDFHSCGCVQEIVPDLIAVGIDILNPVQVRANDRARIKQMTRDRIAVLGGIDSYVVHCGTPDDVRREVRAAFDVWKPGARWLAAPDQVLTGAPEANIRTLWEECWKLADY